MGLHAAGLLRIQTRPALFLCQQIDGDVRAICDTKTSNLALDRRDLTDTGAGIDTVPCPGSCTTRSGPRPIAWTRVEVPVEQDFFFAEDPARLDPPGTAIYDTTGHVMIVYEVAADGRILYMDAYPDESVSRGVYGRHVPRKFRVARRRNSRIFVRSSLSAPREAADGHYIGGHVVVASNEAMADFSLEQYRGNAPDARDGQRFPSGFRYNNVPVDFYEYTRASMSNGGFAFNPVYEIEVTMGSLCREAKAGGTKTRMRTCRGRSRQSLFRHVEGRCAVETTRPSRGLSRQFAEGGRWPTRMPRKRMPASSITPATTRRSRQARSINSRAFRPKRMCPA